MFSFDVVAKDTSGTAFDKAIDHVAACDLADLWYAEDLANFCVAGDHFALGRFEQTKHRFANFLFDFVDDGVESNVDSLGFGDFSRASLGPHVEANDHRCPVHVVC